MKKPIVLVPIMLFIFICYFYVAQNDNINEKKGDEITVVSVVNNQPQLSFDKKESSKKLNMIKLATEMNSNNSSISIDDALDMLDWQYNNGYPQLDGSGSPILEDYDSYDLEILEQLAQNGDIKAMQKLGEQLMTAGKFEKAEEYFWKASVRGYTYTILELSNIYIAKSNNAVDENNKRELAIQAYGYMKLALKRGDSLSNFSMKMYGFNFNDIEQAKIDNLAARHYNKLTSEREALSLQEFDNSSPRALAQILEQQFKIE